MEVKLKAIFALGLHLYRTHAETFYILASGETGRRMLMIYQPSGFDEYLAELTTLSDVDFADEQKMTALNERYDIINLGPLPAGQPSA